MSASIVVVCAAAVCLTAVGGAWISTRHIVRWIQGQTTVISQGKREIVQSIDALADARHLAGRRRCTAAARLASLPPVPWPDQGRGRERPGSAATGVAIAAAGTAILITGIAIALSLAGGGPAVADTGQATPWWGDRPAPSDPTDAEGSVLVADHLDGLEPPSGTGATSVPATTETPAASTTTAADEDDEPPATTVTVDAAPPSSTASTTSTSTSTPSTTAVEATTTTSTSSTSTTTEPEPEPEPPRWRERIPGGNGHDGRDRDRGYDRSRGGDTETPRCHVVLRFGSVEICA